MTRRGFRKSYAKGCGGAIYRPDSFINRKQKDIYGYAVFRKLDPLALGR